MIPKVIHYCWFGGKPLDEECKKCIKSWEQYLPDYKIIRWDESNYDIKKNDFMYEAYKAKKWAFVSDYARLDIIYQYGGIYLDTDVEVIKNFDNLLHNEAFMGFERGKYISTGLGFGSIPKHSTIKKILELYVNMKFINEEGTFNLVNCPIITSDFLVKRGAIMNDSFQTIDGITLYPTEYFCPMDYNTGKLEITKNTYSIHRYSMSWVDKDEVKWHRRQQKLSRIIGFKSAHFIIDILSIPYRILRKMKRILKRNNTNKIRGEE